MGVATTLVAIATRRRNEVEAELELARHELAGRVEARTADLVHRTRELEREAEVRRAAEADALAGTRAKSAFLAAMSHELRTPLNAILGYTDLVADELDEPPVATADLARIREAGLQLLALVDEVLDLARVESGRAEVVRRPFAVRSLVEDVASTLRPMAARSDTGLVVEVDADAASMVGDQARTRQILLNLASNAVRCTPGGHVTVRVTRSAGEQRFEVIDDGPGLPAEVRARLFQRFAPTSADGTGLGLAISHELATLLGGRLELVDTATGTTFRLSLPE
jgi:signal transduction histidine kinase